MRIYFADEYPLLPDSTQRVIVGTSYESQSWVIVEQENLPFLMIDIRTANEDQAFVFQDAIIWHEFAVIGFGHYVHFVPLAEGEPISFRLDSYFGYLYPLDTALLVASGYRVYRFNPDASCLWISASVGLDGVIIHEIDDQTIRGEGEYDPPRGWRPFQLDFQSGKKC